MDQNKINKLANLDRQMSGPTQAEKTYQKMTKWIDKYMKSINCDDSEWRRQVLIDFSLFYTEQIDKSN